jgi:hypothetical protein
MSVGPRTQSGRIKWGPLDEDVMIDIGEGYNRAVEISRLWAIDCVVNA